MSFSQLLTEARSVRRFDHSRPVGREALEEIVSLLRLTPATANVQPLKYYLAADEATCSAIRPLTAWARMLPNYSGPTPAEDPTAYIVICHDLEVSPNPDAFLRDVGICAQTVNLAAREMGIGCCMIGSFDKVKLSELLSLPDNLAPNLICALGYPAEFPVIENAQAGETAYWRDANGTHHVPKRPLAELIINK